MHSRGRVDAHMRESVVLIDPIFSHLCGFLDVFDLRTLSVVCTSARKLVHGSGVRIPCFVESVRTVCRLEKLVVYSPKLLDVGSTAYGVCSSDCYNRCCVVSWMKTLSR
eukprot:3859034-Rhodomonas_salina.1